MTIISTVSKAGTEFIAKHESPGGRAVTRAYRCPAGVLTIGHGFTMRSRVFAGWWRAKHGRDLRIGDTITQSDADMLLARLVNEEYGAAVSKTIKPSLQHHFDGASSVAFNCGPGSLSWKWSQALASGKIAEAAERLRSTAVTANGRRLAGLVRRRAEEAELIQHGRYGSAPFAASAVSTTVDEIREYQSQLAKLGYDVGPVDGKVGPRTIAAVRQFQSDHSLVVDGIVGPATRSTLIRALDAKLGNQAIAVGGGAGAGLSFPDLSGQPIEALMSAAGYGLAGLVVVGLVVTAFRFRGVLTGRRVPV